VRRAGQWRSLSTDKDTPRSDIFQGRVTVPRLALAGGERASWAYPARPRTDRVLEWRPQISAAAKTGAVTASPAKTAVPAPCRQCSFFDPVEHSPAWLQRRLIAPLACWRLP
jgi:hypothetical protein